MHRLQFQVFSLGALFLATFSAVAGEHDAQIREYQRQQEAYCQSLLQARPETIRRFRATRETEQTRRVPLTLKAGSVSGQFNPEVEFALKGAELLQFAHHPGADLYPVRFYLSDEKTWIEAVAVVSHSDDWSQELQSIMREFLRTKVAALRILGEGSVRIADLDMAVFIIPLDDFTENQALFVRATAAFHYFLTGSL